MNENKKDIQSGEILKIVPVILPGDVLNAVSDKQHPMLCVGRYSHYDPQNFNRQEREYAFCLITDKKHYDKGIVLNKDNCEVIKDKDFPVKPSVVNCAIQFRVKESNLSKFLTLVHYPFPKQPSTAYCISGETILNVQDKFEDVIDKNEHCIMYLDGTDNQQHIIKLGKNYLNNWNKVAMEKMDNDRFEKQSYISAKKAVQEHHQTMLVNINKER